MIGPVMGHLGTRVSALLDGRMPPADEERWWEHVHQCHPCRDLVEREGWVKTRLAGLSRGDASAPDRLKHSLLAAPPLGPRPGEELLGHPRARSGGLLGSIPGGVVGGVVGGVLGSGAVGVAVVGVLALGAGPANAPQNERRGPITSITRQTPTVTPGVDPTGSPSGSPTHSPTVERSGGSPRDAADRRTRAVHQGGIREKMGR